MNKLFLIAGPCIIENSEIPLFTGKAVKSICDELGIDFIFKASFKKANRTRIESFKGIGFHESLEILQGVGRELSVKNTYPRGDCRGRYRGEQREVQRVHAGGVVSRA